MLLRGQDPENKEYLRFLSMVSLLSFDVYMKKTVIENLIASYNENSGHKTEKKDKDN